MLRTLLESQAVHARRTGGTLVSVAVHTGVIALAIAATARATSAPAAPPAGPPRPVTWVKPITTNPPTPTRGEHFGSTIRPNFRVLLPPLKIPSQLPPIVTTQSPIAE